MNGNEVRKKSYNGPPRTYITLKSKYEQIKKDVRKKVAGNKQQLFKTGGGTPQISPLTTVEETIYNLILVSVEGLPPRYDDNDDDNNSIELHHEPIEETIGNSLEEEEKCDEIEQEEDEEVIYLQCDQEEVKLPASTSGTVKCFETPDKEYSVINRPQRWNPKSLKRPISKELQVNNPAFISSTAIFTSDKTVNNPAFISSTATDEPVPPNTETNNLTVTPSSSQGTTPENRSSKRLDLFRKRQLFLEEARLEELKAIRLEITEKLIEFVILPESQTEENEYRFWTVEDTNMLIELYGS
ncbi:unnamed protein product [Psylliodes chrysocephalus]|uniref:Uncharacterized protein n=1 Tax=Psylliodes chrysocephalus TaxID=3402493 RepID=A0A9P0CUN1_9CUCU|nr:unnamed protein product [Psylliodes chrysocephala]